MAQDRDPKMIMLCNLFDHRMQIPRSLYQSERPRTPCSYQEREQSRNGNGNPRRRSQMLTLGHGE